MTKWIKETWKEVKRQWSKEQQYINAGEIILAVAVIIVLTMFLNERSE